MAGMVKNPDKDLKRKQESNTSFVLCLLTMHELQNGIAGFFWLVVRVQ